MTVFITIHTHESPILNKKGRFNYLNLTHYIRRTSYKDVCPLFSSKELVFIKCDTYPVTIEL